MENQGNPWGMNQGERGDWAEGLEVPIVDPGEPLAHEYLYWVGCAGSFDDKNKKVTQAMAKILAQPNVEMLNGMGVRKIITQCPHCFNVMKNEYPQLGGNYEVIHHSQFLE